MNEEEIRDKDCEKQLSPDKTSVQHRRKCPDSSSKGEGEHRSKHTTNIRFIDLFGGIGGFHLGLEKANKKNNARTHKSKHEKEDTRRGCELDVGWNVTKAGFNCIWYCDKDKYAVETYNKNFKTQYRSIDIRQVKASNIPDFDMLCAGFPCQSFSIAGKRKGFEDTRGTLFFEICRIAQEKKPRMLFLENVKGLLSHDDGRTFAKILVSLDELGYDVEWQVLNSKNFGVPQNRERVFIIGHLRGSSPEQVFPLRNNGELSAKTNGTTEPSSQTEISTTLKNKNVRSDDTFILHNIYEGFNERKPRIFKNMSPTIRTPKGGGHLPVVMEHKKITERSGKYGDGFKQDESFCLDSGGGRDLIIHPQIRRLTPVECERLQSFPDNWTEGVSDTQRYKQLGNAVTVNVIEAIGLIILEVINDGCIDGKGIKT